jgi:hypothetical protein
VIEFMKRSIYGLGIENKCAGLQNSASIGKITCLLLKQSLFSSNKRIGAGGRCTVHDPDLACGII